VKVEVLHAGGCARCLRELPALEAAARSVDPSVEWRELDIVQAIDYAVELGVLKPPAIAIDGELAFPSLPRPEELAVAMHARLRD
jgi:hypothetical protein